MATATLCWAAPAPAQQYRQRRRYAVGVQRGAVLLHLPLQLPARGAHAEGVCVLQVLRSNAEWRRWEESDKVRAGAGWRGSLWCCACWELNTFGAVLVF